MRPPPLIQRIKICRRAICTALGLGQHGFFIPFKHASSVPSTPPVYAELEAIFRESIFEIQSILDLIASNEELAQAMRGPLDGHWNGGYFGPLDTAATFALARDRAPRTLTLNALSRPGVAMGMAIRQQERMSIRNPMKIVA